MSASYLAACGVRTRDVALHRAIRANLGRSATDEPLWRIAWHEGRGRCLVAARDLPVGMLVFAERPLVVAETRTSGDERLRGEAQAVALELLRKPVPEALHLCRPSLPAGSQEASSLAKATAEFVAAVPEHSAQKAGFWLGVASVNVHSTTKPQRAYLGLLASMMEHDCAPSGIVNVGADAISYRTRRAVAAGEPLSISYVASYQPTATRRFQLRSQHGFQCDCLRCEAAPELVRCFQCPRDGCGGAASPANSRRDCRELVCDDCCGAGESLVLDDAGWAALVEAEECAVLSASCLAYLHPYHHRMVAAYRANAHKVPIEGGQRAEVFCQFADAQIRLTGNPRDPLAAADLERAAVAFRAAGDVEQAASTGSAAADAYAAHFGVDSAEARRCRKAIEGG